MSNTKKVDSVIQELEETDMLLGEIAKGSRVHSNGEKASIELIKFKRCYLFVRLIELFNNEPSRLSIGDEKSGHKRVG